MRKKVSLSVFGLFLCTVLLFFTATGCGKSSEDEERIMEGNTDISSSSDCTGSVEIFSDKEFHYQFIRAMNLIPFGGADVQECLDTASRISDGDMESWHNEWLALAERVYAHAEDFAKEGNTVSARNHYLKASGYYRNASFFLHANPSDERIYEMWEKSCESFRKASSLYEPSIESVEIPYENTAMPAYFYRVDETGKERPTIIVHTGFDGTKEELFPFGLDSIRRGYNCIIFEGPGQGEMITEKGLPFRADWENVVTPVVDYLLSRQDVDKDRIALIGLSLGGYLAPRGASGEHRLAALVANGGVFFPCGAVLESIMRNPEMPQTADELIEAMKADPDTFNAYMEEAMSSSNAINWAMGNGMYTFKASTPVDYLIKYSEMTMEGRAEMIKCPSLIIDSENDMSFPGQPQKLYDALQCEKEMIIFKADDSAGEHCQVGASMFSNDVVFNWLDKHLMR